MKPRSLVWGSSFCRYILGTGYSLHVLHARWSNQRVGASDDYTRSLAKSLTNFEDCLKKMESATSGTHRSERKSADVLFSATSCNAIRYINDNHHTSPKTTAFHSAYPSIHPQFSVPTLTSPTMLSASSCDTHSKSYRFVSFSR